MLEKTVQRLVTQVYGQAGGVVYDLSQDYRPDKCRHCGGRLGRGAASTRQTPGIADLYVVFPDCVLWHEVKALTARMLRPCLPTGNPWINPSTGKRWAETHIRGLLRSGLYDRALAYLNDADRAKLYRAQQTDHQVIFQRHQLQAGIPYVLGGVLEAEAVLARHKVDVA